MSDEKRKKLQEKNINKLNPYKERVKKYFPNGGEDRDWETQFFNRIS